MATVSVLQPAAQQGILDILSLDTISDDDVVALLKTVSRQCKRAFEQPASREDAAQQIIALEEDAETFLKRQKVSVLALRNYVRSRRVHGGPLEGLAVENKDKRQMIDIILDYWSSLGQPIAAQQQVPAPQPQPQQPRLDVQLLARLFLEQLDQTGMAAHMFHPECTLHIRWAQTQTDENHQGRDVVRAKMAELAQVYNFQPEPYQAQQEHYHQFKVLMSGVVWQGATKVHSYAQGFTLTEQGGQWLIMKVLLKFDLPPAANVPLPGSQGPRPIEN